MTIYTAAYQFIEKIIEQSNQYKYSVCYCPWSCYFPSRHEMLWIILHLALQHFWMATNLEFKIWMQLWRDSIRSNKRISEEKQHRLIFWIPHIKGVPQVYLVGILVIVTKSRRVFSIWEGEKRERRNKGKESCDNGFGVPKKFHSNSKFLYIVPILCPQNLQGNVFVINLLFALLYKKVHK